MTRVIHPGGATDVDTVSAMRREMDVLRNLRHAHIVSVIGFAAGPPATVTYEPVRGTTLRRILAVNRQLDATAAVVLFDDCLAALQALHRRGVLLGGLRPAEVAVEDSGVAMVRNAGLAWTARDHRSVAADLVAASSVFHQAVTGFELDAASAEDVAALGVLRSRLVLRLAPDEAVVWPSAAHGRRVLAGEADELLGAHWRQRGRERLARAARARLDDAHPADETLMILVPAAVWRDARRHRARLSGLRIAAAVVTGIVTLATAVSLVGAGVKKPTPAPAALRPVGVSRGTATLWPAGVATEAPGHPATTLTPDPLLFGLAFPFGSPAPSRTPSHTPKPTRTPRPSTSPSSTPSASPSFTPTPSPTPSPTATIVPLTPPPPTPTPSPSPPPTPPPSPT